MHKAFISAIITILILGGLTVTQVNAARFDNIWEERLGTYVELIWSEGRDVLIRGTNKYLNFGTFSGTSGYGFRDNSGAIEYKDSGGSWTAINTLGGGGSSLHVDGGGFVYPQTGDYHSAPKYVATSTTEASVFEIADITQWISQQGNVGLSLTDDGSDLTLVADVGGVNSFNIETAGSFFNLVANPGPANDYLMASIAETQGDTTQLNFYKGGTGHNRFWDSGSMRIGGGEGHLCSKLTSDVDCDTAGTGADLVLQDDFWLGGNILATSTTGTSSIYHGLSVTGETYLSTTTFPSAQPLIFRGNPLTSNLYGGIEFIADSFNTKHTIKWSDEDGNRYGYLTMHEHSEDAPHFSIEVPQTKGGGPNSVVTVDSWCDGSTDDTCGVAVTTGANFYVTSGKSRFGGTIYSDAGVKTGFGTPTPDTILTVARGSNIPDFSFVQTATAINDSSSPWLGEISWRGNDKASGEEGVGAVLECLASDFWNGTTNDYPTDCYFATTPNGAGALATSTIWRSTGAFEVLTALEIPNGTAPTVDATGELAFDTTDNQLLIGDSGGTARVMARSEMPLFSTTVASTSVEFVSGGVLPIAKNLKDGRDITQFRCYVIGGTSIVANVSDGTNDTETITCATTMTSDTDVATNSTFTANEFWELQIGTITGSPDYLVFEAYGYITRE